MAPLFIAAGSGLAAGAGAVALELPLSSLQL